jgi:hypothetical protein
VKRPNLTLSGQSIDQEEYDLFQYQSVQYKERLGDNMDNPARLLECLLDDMSKMLYSSLGTEIKNLTEQEIFENIITCCVTKQTVRRGPQSFTGSGRSRVSNSRASLPTSSL